MSPKTIMLFSHICNEAHMTGAEKLLLFMLRELAPTNRCLLVVPNEGLLAQEARGVGFEVIIESYPLMWQLWEPSPSLHEEEGHWNHGERLSPITNLYHMHRPDLVISHTCVNALPAMAARRIGIPVLWMITETMCETPHTGEAVSLIHRYSDWIAGISESTLAPFRRAGLSDKIFLLYPSWRQESLHPHVWEHYRHVRRAEYLIGEGEVVVGFIASDLTERKGLSHFIEMAVHLCPLVPHARFYVVGKPSEPEYYDRCIRRIHESGHASRFVIQPYGSAIESIYPAMDVVVVPSLIHEGFGMTALEGMIFGKPVIAYGAGGLQEMLSSLGAGQLLAPFGDLDTLTSIVYQVTADPQTCRVLGPSYQAAAHQVYGIDSYRSRLHTMIHSMLPSIDHVEQHRAAMRGHVAEGSLLKGAETPAVFLIQGGHKRVFTSEGALLGHGFHWSQVQTVPDGMLPWFPNGEPIR